MPRKNKTRYLRLQVKVYAPGVDAQTAKETLIRSIQNGSYEYPKGWKVGIYWSNNPRSLEMKSGEFTREMRASRSSSTGFDYAVIDYLRSR